VVVIANAVAALTEISERSDNIHLRFNSDVARRLVRAMSASIVHVHFGDGDGGGFSDVGVLVLERVAERFDELAALTEISERSDNIHLRFNSDVARRLVRAMSEASECVSRNLATA
jgi:vacuolar-type H+-ATPase subunit E/Vma4